MCVGFAKYCVFNEKTAARSDHPTLEHQYSGGGERVSAAFGLRPETIATASPTLPNARLGATRQKVEVVL